MREHPHQLELQPLTTDAWRLFDRVAAVGDATSVVAYVERRRDGRFEATWVSCGFGVAVYTSLESLMDDAASRLAASDRPADSELGRTTKPVPIPHRPPMAV